MCGICGYAGFEPDKNMLQRMTDVIIHRGPDDAGMFLHDRIGLSMRRLSIIDVAKGRQPISNEDGKVTIVYNGEIYNYRSLRDDLIQKNHRFSTESDTETILHLYEEYGTECVKYLRGMFAFALYDARKEQLFLARDRLGIKPLYYWSQGDKLLFGSEIKSILECRDVNREPNMCSIDAYLTLRFVPGPETMFIGINKMPAGHWLLWKEGRTYIKCYWTPQIYSGPYKSDDYYHEYFAELFAESVRIRLMSEVPLGAYLSGGVDSSAIVATMSRITEQPVKTFTVGFDWKGDELPVARDIARKLGCEHYEIICNSKDFELLPKIIWNLDEPIGDAIIMPMYLLSRLAHEHVTVVLSGEGADETMAGYFFHKAMIWAKWYSKLLPRTAREKIIEPIVKHTPPFLLNLAFDYPGSLGNRGHQKLLDYLSLVGEKNLRSEYHFLLSLFDYRDKNEIYNKSLQPFLSYDRLSDKSNDFNMGLHFFDEVLLLQYAQWLPDNILMKQDKLSMAHSIETRVPFLDHHLVEFLLQVPQHLKLSGAMNKIILRNHLEKLLLVGISQRKKKAFYIPIEKYFSEDPLRGMINDCLSERSVKRRGYFKWEAVSKLRKSIGDANKGFLFSKQVFSLIALELWHKIYIDKEKGWNI